MDDLRLDDLMRRLVALQFDSILIICEILAKYMNRQILMRLQIRIEFFRVGRTNLNFGYNKGDNEREQDYPWLVGMIIM